MKKLLVVFYCLNLLVQGRAQNDPVKDLWIKYRQAGTDTAKARLLDRIANYYSFTDIDSAFFLANKALQIAVKHNDKVLERDILVTQSSLLATIGANELALQIAFKLLEEAKAMKNTKFEIDLYNSIAMYYFLNVGDLENGKKYSYRIMKIPGWEKYKRACVSLYINLGDYFTKISRFDSALHYTNKAYELAYSLGGSKENDFTSTIKNNFGNLYLKMNQPEMALLYYRQSLSYALATSYTDVICETSLGLARIYENQQLQDSVLHYAGTSLSTALKARHQSYLLMSSNYLAEYYKKIKRSDSAVKYYSMSSSIRDSLFNSEKINKIKAMEMEEAFRQQERILTESKVEMERRVNIQYAILLIGIVGLLILVLFLSRSFIVHHNWVRFLGVLSLLLVFEFINLYLHPLLDKLTGHSPIAMLLIMAGIASLLIPLHHRLEHWITTKLVEKNKQIRLAAAKKIIADLET